jgi:HEAT repeat protein
MYRMELAVVVAAATGVGGWWAPVEFAPDQAPAQAAHPVAGPGEVPPSPWLQGDPADSLYRAAREALNRREYRAAADLFAELPGRFPRSGYAGDAYYWQAFALYRLGGEPRLRDAMEALRVQRERYPKTATSGDARALERRIQGELARGGDSQAAEEVTEAAAEAADAEASSDDCDEDDTKLAALNALIHMNAERAQPILKRVLARRDAGSACLRRKAVFLVSQGGEGVEPILLESARNDPDREVREQAVFWLSQVSGPTAVAALDSILRTSKDVGVQEKALFALSQHGTPEAQRALRGYAERADLRPELREKAVFWIGQSGGAEDAQYLRGLFGRIKEEELRKKILFSLSQMGGQENGRWLLGVARDRQQPLELRKQALFWAGQGGAPMADLAGLYSTMDDREMREQLIFVYSQREEPAAVDKLLDIARRDTDPEMRKKALFWLGQSDDPRAAKALQDIIEQP